MAANFPLKEKKFQPDLDLWIFQADEGLASQMMTEKEFCFELQYGHMTDGCAQAVAQHIKEAAACGGEIEVWNVWLCADEDEPDVEYWEVAADQISAKDVVELHNCPSEVPQTIHISPAQYNNADPFYERFTQYCMIVRG